MAWSPLSDGRMVRFFHMCVTSRLLNRKQNHVIDAQVRPRYVLRTQRSPTGLIPKRMKRVWITATVTLKAIVVMTRLTDNRVVGILYGRGQSCTMDQACRNSANSTRMVTGMLKMVAATLML